MLKRIALTLFSIITVAVVAVLAIAATRPATYHVERSISTSAAPQAVFDVLNDFHNFPKWSPWQKLDPKMAVKYEGPSSGVGSAYSWVGNGEAGAGKMTITDATPPSSITLKLEFLKPFASTCAVHYQIAPEGGGSHVTWGMDGNNNYVSKVMGLFVSMDQMIGKDFEAGLASLKTVAESPVTDAAAPAATSGGTTATPAKP